jgi:hypothetical protein
VSSILDIDLHTFLDARSPEQATNQQGKLHETYSERMKGFHLGSGRRSEDQPLAILPSINYNGPMADESIGRRQNKAPLLAIQAAGFCFGATRSSTDA